MCDGGVVTVQTFHPCMNAFVVRVSSDDAGEYKVIARSPLGEAMSYGVLVVNCESFSVPLNRIWIIK